jgi:very-short-patch-repair endonuclease
VNGHISALFGQVAEGKTLSICPLPDLEDEPADEKSDRFLTALEALQSTDEEHQAALASLAADELASSKAARIERKLRDKVRESLGLPPWKGAHITGVADYAIKLGIDPSFDLAPTPVANDRTMRSGQVEFQALMLPESLERQLSKIRDTARTIAEETGVSTLHLAFGFLEWFESDSSDKPLTSPLLLMRVDIDRKIARSRYSYFLAGVGDEAQANLTLSERLNRDFRIKLPEFSEDEDPEAYLARVQEEVCKGQKRWTVRRYVTLGHFPFARLAMFQDLDDSQWTESGGLAGHPVLGALLGGTESGSSMFAEEHDVDAPDTVAKVPLLVLEADASQHSAVYDVMSGKNLVIEGPPGTGKSQTITNIIAAALATGKRVLFMADKQAALQVVKDRLDSVGLGLFCLELHSGKARKRDVLDALTERLNHRPTRMGIDDLEAKLRELTETRIALTRYVDTLNTPVGSFGATVHDVLWADRRRRDGEGDVARYLDALELPSCESLTQSDIERRSAVLDRFERAAQPLLSGFDAPAAHPWFGVMRSNLSSVDFEQVVRDIGDVAMSMEQGDRAISALAGLGISAEMVIQDVQEVATAILHLPCESGIPTDWYRGLRSRASRHAVEDWLRACEAYRRTLADLHEQNVHLDGTDALEAAESLEVCWPPLMTTAPEGLSLSGLAGWSTELRDQTAGIHEFVRTAAYAASLLGVATTSRIGDILTILRAIQLVVEAGDAVIAFFTPELADRDSNGIVARAAAEIAELKAREQVFAAKFRIPSMAKPDDLRRHATALRETGMFSFLSSATKSAKQYYRELQKTPAKVDRRDMVTALSSIAEYLESVAALEGKHEYRAIFGKRFCGLSTETGAGLAVADWAGRVRGELAGVDEISLGARRTLLSGDQDRLQALAAFGKGSAFAALGEHVGGLTDLSASLDAIALMFEARATAVDALAATCDRYGVPGSTSAAALPDICRLMRAAHAAEVAARIPSALATALGEPTPRPLDDHGPLRASLTLAAAVDDLPVSDETRRNLQNLGSAEIQMVVKPAAEAVSLALGRAVADWCALQRRLEIDERAFLGRPLIQAWPKAIIERLRLAARHSGDLGSWISYLIERTEAEALDLGGLLSLWDEKTIQGPLSAAFDRLLHRALARRAFAHFPELDRFTGLGQDEARARFKLLDNQATELRRRALALQLASRPVPSGNGVGLKSEYTDRALILLEAGKQKRHIPIRQLLDRAGGAVQALKPCLMMSPLSVSQYLKPTGLRFDLLVIDEASQMRPEDAIGAVARSDQIVVVGDPKQLPPTSFFSQLDGGADGDDGEEEQVDAESILDLAQAVFRPMRRLRWHYRSRHGSLVAFSNREFYDDDLIVFPSPAEADPTQGVTSTKVDGVYKSRSNIGEVNAVCSAAIEHMRRHPGRSLGIATLNQVQRDLIVQEMDRLATVHPEVEGYRKRWSETLERFFIKNLENVQGDERDVIFVSTVFGPSEPGGKVKQVFGPINGATGHRRLNVLFTRAKHHVRVFTSMTPDDVLAGPDSPRGAQVLKAYLAYAATGRLDAGTETGREADSDFEVFVRDRLRLAGYEAIPQVGVAGFFIDLGVRDPDVPGSFILGIECDGASYHSSKSARDRDILRQKILEGLGWNIYRIWSTDWFRDPAGQTKKLIGFLEDLRRRRAQIKMA